MEFVFGSSFLGLLLFPFLFQSAGRVSWGSFREDHGLVDCWRREVRLKGHGGGLRGIRVVVRVLRWWRSHELRLIPGVGVSLAIMWVVSVFFGDSTFVYLLLFVLRVVIAPVALMYFILESELILRRCSFTFLFLIFPLLILIVTFVHFSFTLLSKLYRFLLVELRHQLSYLTDLSVDFFFWIFMFCY